MDEKLKAEIEVLRDRVDSIERDVEIAHRNIENNNHFTSTRASRADLLELVEHVKSLTAEMGLRRRVGADEDARPLVPRLPRIGHIRPAGVAGLERTGAANEGTPPQVRGLSPSGRPVSIARRVASKGGGKKKKRKSRKKSKKKR